MKKSLPSYKDIKDKYINNQALSPIEIGRGLIFLLIEELIEDNLPDDYLAEDTSQENEDFYIAMLQSLTSLSKHYLDTYEMVYYTTVMVCCIRCLVYERKYYIETLSRNLNNCAYANMEMQQAHFIDKAIDGTEDKNICNILKKIKNIFIKSTAQTKKETEYKNISHAILLHLSAIYKFVEIISLNWEMPELTFLFYSSTKKSSYNSWLKATLNEVNKHIFTEPKLNISEVKIQEQNANIISQLLVGRYIDISRINAFLRTLKNGGGLTISGGSQ